MPVLSAGMIFTMTTHELMRQVGLRAALIVIFADLLCKYSLPFRSNDES